MSHPIPGHTYGENERDEHAPGRIPKVKVPKHVLGGTQKMLKSKNEALKRMLKELGK
jgi:hypothetical protein